MSRKNKFWLAGLMLSAIGVLVAKVLSERFEGGTKLAIYAVGTVVAFAGLGVIMYAMKQSSK